MNTVKVFRYLDQLDCFLPSDEYAQLAERLGLVEWHPAVWIGRLFVLDNDFGEHWFDNWDLREEKRAQAEAMGLACEDLLIIDPNWFQNGKDGPCNTPELRKQFWTDVLKSLTLSYELLFEKARAENERIKPFLPDEYIPDLEERIVLIQNEGVVESETQR